MNPSTPTPLICPVTITGIGLYAATGTNSTALWGAVASHLSCSRPVLSLNVPAADQKVEQPHFAPITALPEQLKSPSRIPVMAQEALFRACTALPEDRIGLRILLLTLLPASSPERPNAGNLDREELAASMRGTHPALTMAEVRFATADEGATAHLAKCIVELHQGQWDALLFGGADSLTDRGTVQALAANGRCRTDKHPEGTLPGEGAAYLLLEKQETDRPCLALIVGLGHALEENAGKAANRPMTALTESIEQALDQAQHTPTQVETMVLPMPGDPPATLEWHQVKRKLWAQTDDSNYRMEELLPQVTIGHTGAAELPLALALGCERFNFNYPSVERLLVCEIGPSQARGAVFLKNANFLCHKA